MNIDSKIYLAGHQGLVGSAIDRALTARGYTHLIRKTSAELDLVNQKAVCDFFKREKPEYVILAAAKVGGIHANDTYPAEFLYQNLMIQANVIDAAYRNGVKRLLFLGSSCIYPRAVAQPMREDALLTDVLEPTNEPYAVAKISGIKLCESYNRQYGTDYRSIMPTNLYGQGDNFHLENAHVIPALMRRFHEAKVNRSDKVIIWGNGLPMREFMHVDDMASAALFVLELDEHTYQQNTLPRLSHIDVGTGFDCSIQELVKTMEEVTGFSGEIIFDTGKLGGSPRKLLDVSRLKDMGWVYKIPLKKGLQLTYQWFLENKAAVNFRH